MAPETSDLPKRPLYVVISRRFYRGKEEIRCHFRTTTEDREEALIACVVYQKEEPRAVFRVAEV